MPGQLSKIIHDFGEDKRQRYKGYKELLDRALQAGAQAVIDTPRATPRRGAVWVKLADARSAFGRFLQESGDVRAAGDAEATGRWVRGNRKMGTHLPAELGDSVRAMAWAEAVQNVLASGDVEVTIGHDFITEPGS